VILSRPVLNKKLGVFALLFALLGFGAGCTTESYDSNNLKQALSEICEKEYGIEDIDVKVKGETIGVYLPLKKLFAADFKEAAVTGKVRNLETLFEPSPEALEKVEDVLFSISRVLLSTTRPLKFYVLEATDIEKTGMQLVLTGCVDDIKRVRVWDISRNEYRKRVIHELRLNRAVIWHKPVHKFFRDLEDLTISQVKTRYFGEAMEQDAVQKLFFNAIREDNAPEEQKSEWEILDIRSAAVQRNQVLVYTKVKCTKPGSKESSELQYLFILAVTGDEGKIARIVPFQYKSEDGQLQKIPFPKELRIQENLEQWESEFQMEEVKMGPFLAQQLTRRVQALIAGDERVQNTFREAKMDFIYHEEEPAKPYFSLETEAVLRDLNNYTRQSLVLHEDMIYLLTLASREFVEVLRSYQFGSYDYLKVSLAQEPAPWVIGREDLELFRRKKVDLQGLLTLPKL
jgi:hypothetical protein